VLTIEKEALWCLLLTYRVCEVIDDSPALPPPILVNQKVCVVKWIEENGCACDREGGTVLSFNE